MNQMPTGTEWGQIGMNGLGGAPKDTVADDRNRGEGERLEVPGSTFPHCLEPPPSNLNLVPLRYGCLFN